MAAIEVELPDGSVAEFPDDMAQDKIAEAIKSHLSPRPTPINPQLGSPGADVPPTTTVPASPELAKQLAAVGGDIPQPKATTIADILNKPFEIGGKIIRGAYNIPAQITHAYEPLGPEESLTPKIVSDAVKTAVEKITRPKGMFGEPGPSTDFSKAAGAVAERTSQSLGQPEMLASIPFFESKIVRGLMLASQALQTPEQVKKVADVFKNSAATAQQKWEALGDAGVNLAMTAGLALSLKPVEVRARMTPEEAAKAAETSKPVPPEIQQAKAAGLTQAAAEAEKALSEKGGDQNASENKETTEVHGDVRKQPGQGQGKVPEQSGGEGIQPLGKESETSADVVLKPVENHIAKVLASPAKDLTTEDSFRFGMTIQTPEQLQALREAHATADKDFRDAIAKKDQKGMETAARQKMYFAEAYETATGADKPVFKEKHPDFEPPFPAAPPLSKEGPVAVKTVPWQTFAEASPEDFIKTVRASGFKGATDAGHNLGSKITTADIPALQAEADKAAAAHTANSKAGKLGDQGQKKQLFTEAIRMRQAMDEVIETSAKTDKELAAIAQKHGVTFGGEPYLKAAAEQSKEVSPNAKEEEKAQGNVLTPAAGGETPPAVADQAAKQQQTLPIGAGPGAATRPTEKPNRLDKIVISENTPVSTYVKLMDRRDDIIGDFEVPEGWKLNDINTSNWKSVYWMVESPEGEQYKIRIGNHDSKRTAHGPNDYEGSVPKDFTLEQWKESQRKAEEWLAEKESGESPGSTKGTSAAGIKGKAQLQDVPGVLPYDKTDTTKPQREVKQIPAGPGAATRPGAVLQTDIGAMESNIPPLEKLADAVKRFPQQSGGGFREKLRQWMDDVGIPAKDFATRALVGIKAATANIVNAFTKLAPVTSMDRAVGDWNLADTEGDIAARRFAKAVKDRFPDRAKLRAFSNWINAGGDKELLQRQADLTKDPELKKTYTDALKFGPEEERLGSEIKQYHDEMLAEAMRAGALEEGLENYIHRYYPREDDPTRQRLERAMNEMRFTKNFSGFKRRFYDSDFEAEQAGLKPEKDAAKRILAYDQGFRKALTARAFVKDRYAAMMPDGRPEIDVTGIGVPSKMNVETGKETPYLVKPKSKAGGDSPEDYRGDYVTFDHPAFRRWKWVGQDAQGKPILMEGELAVHPDAVKKYRALFERSWFQKNPVTKALLNLNTLWKQTKLSLSAFHPVQIGEHAMAHQVNPFKLVDLNTRDPAQAELVKGGLVVSDLGGPNHFSEGVGGTGLIGKIPLAGEMLKASQDWLFKDFIPRIKMTMALDALERNRKRYSKQVASGKITDEQLVRLTARESNAAFGEQNYRAMFRNKSFQDVLRFAFLAPDFGESRLRFPIQAATRYGGEQRMALLLSAVGMFVIAKTAEKLMTGRMNLTKPFTVTVNNREYGLRNVASDLYHMITDPSGYLRNRLSTYTRPALEMLSGRDAFGRKRTVSEQVIDQLKDAVPISGRGLVEKDQSLWESFINAIGLTEHRASAFGQAMKAVNAWKEKKGYTEPGEFVYHADKDPYSRLTTVLTYGSPGDARKQLDTLTAGKTPLEVRKIAQHYRRSLAEHPYLTGSRAHEQEYVKTLDASGKSAYDEAKAERRAMWQKFVKVWRSKYPAATQ